MLMVSRVDASPATAAESGNQRPELDSQAFLNLLVTQLQHQDPLEPMEQSEFISQLAQLQAVQEASELNDNVCELIGLQAWTNVLGLLGRQVTAINPATGEMVHGVVEGIDLGAGPPGIVIDGVNLRLEDIVAITA